MEQAWRDDQLRRIGGGTSIFGRIPAEIGRVVYCDSTTGKAEGKFTFTLGEILSICFGLLSGAVAIFCIKYYRDILFIIGFGGASIILLFCGFIEIRFRGTDYLVGEKGFAKLSFMRSRSSFQSADVVRYDDIAYFCISEEEVWTQTRFRSYMHTIRNYTFYGVDSGGSKATKLIRLGGQFSDQQDHYADNPDGPNEDFLFLRRVEDALTRRFLSKVGGDDVISFYRIDADGNLHHRVDVHPWGLRVKNHDNASKDILFDEIAGLKFGGDNSLDIELVNYTQRREFAFVTIDYSSLANGKALLSIIYDRAKYATPPNKSIQQ